jgi:Cys-rich protein (TIGR01571 family)
MSAPWDTGLFDCCSDCKVCCVSWMCGVCQIAYQKAAVEEHECGCGDLIPVVCCPFCCQISTRSKIREKYGIEGSGCGDCMTSWCCMLCAISQQTRQLDMKGAKPAGMCMEK